MATVGGPPPDDAPSHEHARFLATLGLRVHPLHHIQSDGLSCSCLVHDSYDPATGEPLYCTLGNRSAGKHPRLKAWPERASNEPAAVHTLFTQTKSRQRSNIAVATGPESGVLVLDVDPKHGGDDALAELVARYGPLPDTWQTLTPSGGLHLWFRYPKDLPQGRAIGNVNSGSGDALLGPGLDVRAVGGYVVVPPSSRGVLGDYVWELSSLPWEVPLADCPRWLIDRLLSTPQSVAASRPGTPRRPDAAYPPADIGAIEAGCAWLRRCRDEASRISQWEWRQALSVWGRCGDGEALAHARSQLDPRRYTAAATSDTLRQALGRAGPVRCARVETDPGIRFPGCATCPHHGLIASPIMLGRQTPETRAYSDRAAPEAPPPPRATPPVQPDPQTPPAGGSPPDPPPAADAPGGAGGAVGAAPHPGAAASQQEARQARRKVKWPRILTAEQLLGLEFPQREEVLLGLPRGVLAVAIGKPKTGKSILLMQGSLGVAAGGPLFGRDIEVTSGECLYLDLENGDRRVQHRVRALLGEEGERRLEGRWTFANDWPAVDEGGLLMLTAWLEAHPACRLVVIDTLKRVRPKENGSGRQRLYDLDYDALAPLADLAHTHNVTIVVIHHSRKADASDILDVASGSSGLTAAVDTVMVWRRARGRPEAKLFVSDRDQGEVEHAFLWTAHIQGWSWQGSIAFEGDVDSPGEHGPGSPSSREEVENVLRQVGRPLSPMELAAFLHKNGNAMRVQLWTGVRSGWIERVEERNGDSGPERGSFYRLPPHENRTNGLMRGQNEGSYQISEGPEGALAPTHYQDPLLMHGTNALADPSSHLGADPENGAALGISSDFRVEPSRGVGAVLDALAAGRVDRQTAAAAALSLAGWLSWSGLGTPSRTFGFPPARDVADHDLTEQEREAAWRRDVAGATDTELAEVWVRLWSRRPPASYQQWAPPEWP